MSDLISRSALLESIKDVEVSWYMDGNYSTYDDTTIVDIISEQPTVEARPCGKWEETEEAIKEFAKWCYVKGIDFSYMAKATDTEPFVATVIKKYNADMRGGKNE